MHYHNRLVWLGQMVLAAALLQSCQSNRIPAESSSCSSAPCSTGYACDTKRYLCVKTEQLCVDADGDGFGEGAACKGIDCDDTTPRCTADCASDRDRDRERDCDDHCVDADGDGYGVGPACTGPDCDDTVAACNATCGDLDADGLRDCDVDRCVDVDDDGLGRSGYAATGGAALSRDADDNDAHRCTDSDADGCDDCVRASFAPRDDGIDDDGDGFCAVTDCDDDDPVRFPGNPEVCDAKDNDCNKLVDDGLVFSTYYRDLDGDGYGNANMRLSACKHTAGYVGDMTDCDDTIPNCTTDCTTNTDGAGESADGETLVVDCFERYCGSDPTRAASHCLRVTSAAAWNAAAATANNAPETEAYHILLGNFGTTHKLDALTNDHATMSVRQEVGASLTASFTAFGGPLFELGGTLATVGPLHVVANANVQTVIEVTNDVNTVSDVIIEGNPIVGISIGGGSNVVSATAITGASSGIVIEGTSNEVSATITDTIAGISITGGSNTVSSTTITGASTAIGLGGTGNEVSTTITDAATGIDVTGANNKVSATTIADAATGIVIWDAALGNVISSTTITNAGTGISITGAMSKVSSTTITGFADRGIHVEGGLSMGTLIAECVIAGGTGAPDDGRGAVVLVNTPQARLVHNVIAANAMAGVLVDKASGLWIDQNTVADNGGDGVKFFNRSSTAVCMRSNLVSGNAGYALVITSSSAPTWETDGAECTAPLEASGAGYDYRNAQNGNAAACSASSCRCTGSITPCLPKGSFWPLSPGPDPFASTTAGAPSFYCLAPGNALINAGVDLGYDLNGSTAGSVNGSAPDIGGREKGANGCP